MLSHPARPRRPSLSCLLSLTTERCAKLIVFALLAAMASRVSLDPDMWWHLRLGEQIANGGAPVYADVYSHTRLGEIHYNHSWLAQAVMFGAWRLAGHLGLTALTSTLATAGMFFLYRAGRGGIYAQGFVLVFGAACAAAFWSPRPQMFTFLFSAVLIFILFDLKRRGRDRLWWLLPLMWLWGNCHGGYIIGYGLIAAFVTGEAMNRALALGERRAAPGTIRKLAAIALLSLLAMPLNPLGLEVFAVPFDTISVAGLRQYILEWQSPDFSQANTWGFLILLFLLVASTLASRRRPDATESILVLGALAMALLSARNLSLFAVVATPIASHRLDLALKRRAWSIPRREREAPARVVINLILLAMVCLGTWLHIAQVTSENTVKMAAARNYPVEAARQLTAAALEGKLFNSYNWGGYLIFAAPGQPVFIDGRADLHRDALADYVSALGSPGWRDIFEKWDIAIALIETTSSLAAQLEAAEDWRRHYADDVASVYVRARK